MSDSPAVPIAADPCPDPVEAPRPEVTQAWAERCLSEISTGSEKAGPPATGATRTP